MPSELQSLVLPKGSRLFHGTIEDLEGGLLPGGVDQVLWFADVPAVAQLYIPRSGLTVYASSQHLRHPTEDTSVQVLQRLVGLEYDLGQVTRDTHGRVKSYRIPEGWDQFDPNFEIAEEIERRLAELGYEGKGTAGWRQYEFHFSGGKVLAPGATQQGTLCVATTTRDMKLWHKATGEGDLMDLQYHDLEGFRSAAQAGFDGVMIDDFAQSEMFGNFGHLSVGLFGPAIADLDISCVPATYEEWARRSETEAWPHKSPSYFHRLREANPMARMPTAARMEPRHRLKARLSR